MLPRLTFTRSTDERNAWCLWLGLFVVLAAGICLGNLRAVASHYAQAARDWGEGQPLYNGWGVGFLYLPQAAILHSPFAQLPRVPAEILWRALTIGIFALGLYRLCRLAERDHHVGLFPLATCVSLPLAFAAARNGQATLLIAGLIMLAIDELVNRRWTRSAALLCLALAFKPLALPFALVIAAVHRPLLWRVALGMLLVALFPYITQDWGYVTDQYRECAAAMRIAADLGIATPWAQLMGLFNVSGLPLPVAWQTPLRVLAGTLVFGVCWLAQRRLPAHRYALYLFSVTTIYMLLFNPRTENNTYAFLAPAIGVSCAEAFVVQRNRRLGIFLILIALGILGSYELGRRIAPQTPPVWPAPLMAVGFSIVLYFQVRREIRSAKSRTRRTVLPAPHAHPVHHRVQSVGRTLGGTP